MNEWGIEFMKKAVQADLAAGQGVYPIRRTSIHDANRLRCSTTHTLSYSRHVPQTARLSTGTLRFRPMSCSISVQKPTGGVMKDAS